MNKRELLANLCERSGATQLVLALRRYTRPSWLQVLTFHRVARIGPDYAFDDGVVDTSPGELDRQLSVLRRHFSPITLADVRAMMDDGAPLPNNPVLVTFDDGYLDNYTVALPLLRKYGVRATFFIATRYIQERRMFWWDRIAYVIKRSARATIKLAYPEPMDLPRAEATRRLLRLVKSTKGLDLDRFLDELCLAADVTWTRDVERRFANEHLMTWDHVRALKAAGMDIQSHTRTHRVLQTLSTPHVVDELVGSRADLEAELDAPIYAISYPVGHTINDRDDVRVALASAGYRLGFTNATGAQPLRGRGIDRFNMSRMGLDAHTPASLFRAMLALPMVFD